MIAMSYYFLNRKEEDEEEDEQSNEANVLGSGKIEKDEDGQRLCPANQAGEKCKINNCSLKHTSIQYNEVKDLSKHRAKAQGKVITEKHAPSDSKSRVDKEKRDKELEEFLNQRVTNKKKRDYMAYGDENFMENLLKSGVGINLIVYHNGEKKTLFVENYQKLEEMRAKYKPENVKLTIHPADVDVAAFGIKSTDDWDKLMKKLALKQNIPETDFKKIQLALEQKEIVDLPSKRAPGGSLHKWLSYYKLGGFDISTSKPGVSGKRVYEYRGPLDVELWPSLSKLQQNENKVTEKWIPKSKNPYELLEQKNELVDPADFSEDDPRREYIKVSVEKTGMTPSKISLYPGLSGKTDERLKKEAVNSIKVLQRKSDKPKEYQKVELKQPAKLSLEQAEKAKSELERRGLFTDALKRSLVKQHNETKTVLPDNDPSNIPTATVGYFIRKNDAKRVKIGGGGVSVGWIHTSRHIFKREVPTDADYKLEDLQFVLNGDVYDLYPVQNDVTNPQMSPYVDYAKIKISQGSWGRMKEKLICVNPKTKANEQVKIATITPKVNDKIWLVKANKNGTTIHPGRVLEVETAEKPEEQSKGYGNFVHFYHNCDCEPGESGTWIFNAAGQLVGIHKSGGSPNLPIEQRRNRAVAITTELNHIMHDQKPLTKNL